MNQSILTVVVVAIILAPSDKKLIDVGTNLKVRSIATGELHPEFQKLAEEHAADQAKRQHQDHRGFQKRSAILQKKAPDTNEWAEVVAESFPGQSMNDAAKEMYKSWESSRRHWRDVNGPCDYYGYSMRRDANGVWYACAIFGYKKPRN